MKDDLISRHDVTGKVIDFESNMPHEVAELICLKCYSEDKE